MNVVANISWWFLFPLNMKTLFPQHSSLSVKCPTVILRYLRYDEALVACFPSQTFLLCSPSRKKINLKIEVFMSPLFVEKENKTSWCKWAPHHSSYQWAFRSLDKAATMRDEFSKSTCFWRLKNFHVRYFEGIHDDMHDYKVLRDVDNVGDWRGELNFHYQTYYDLFWDFYGELFLLLPRPAVRHEMSQNGITNASWKHSPGCPSPTDSDVNKNEALSSIS